MKFYVWWPESTSWHRAVIDSTCDLAANQPRLWAVVTDPASTDPWLPEAPPVTILAPRADRLGVWSPWDVD